MAFHSFDTNSDGTLDRDLPEMRGPFQGDLRSMYLSICVYIYMYERVREKDRYRGDMQNGLQRVVVDVGLPYSKLRCEVFQR